MSGEDRPLRTLLLCAVLALVACACTQRTPLTRGTVVDFTDEGATQQSGYEGPGPAVSARKGGPGWLVTVFQGRQSTGGYVVRVERMTSTGTVLHVRARFTVPRPGDMVTQVFTSPAHTVGLPFLADEIVLYDQDDVERVRWRPDASGTTPSPARTPAP